MDRYPDRFNGKKLQRKMAGLLMVQLNRDEEIIARQPVPMIAPIGRRRGANFYAKLTFLGDVRGNGS